MIRRTRAQIPPPPEHPEPAVTQLPTAITCPQCHGEALLIQAERHFHLHTRLDCNHCDTTDGFTP